MTGFKTGQSWRTRKGEIVEIIVRESDLKIETPGCHVILEPHGCFYKEGSALTSPFDLVEQVMRVYIAGPIYKRANRLAFDAAAAEWRNRGCCVINPMDLVPEDTEQGERMRISISALLTCEMIVMLSGWEDSSDASTEHAVAVACRMAIGIPV